MTAFENAKWGTMPGAATPPPGLTGMMVTVRVADLGVWGASPSGVWGRAPAGVRGGSPAKKFLAFLG